ncbi:Propanediol utilization protein [Gracilibacillus ureilyticus]|uniref:Phosphate propanoyltransferase n=1 Tax=Gracilibacillus ureilyticus TaxID=531814 RepID=A0A1H9NZZ2_9BACI|nr:phosphate propanoyltransferase [Gracilibacillus ureilyticus]SER41512.1 Propanediol utilization protein [Gracilibacillus ureilyticus]
MTVKGNETLYRAIRDAVMEEIKAHNIELVQEKDQFIPVSVSARHIHLEQKHADFLFGKGYTFTKHRDISQPGQYSCVEQVTIKGPKSKMDRIRVVAPLRKQTQIEISRTDAIKLGVNPPVRHSGDLKGSAPLTVIGPKGKIELEEGCIIADRHIHMSPADASRYGVENHQKVKIEVDGEKGGMMYGVTVRISDRYALDMHIDTDDANAFGIKGQEYLKLIK